MLRYGTYSFKLSQAEYLKHILKGDIFYQPLSIASPDIYVGWGAKKYAMRAKAAAATHQKPFYFLEDGFLRSLYPSHISKNPLSVILDKKGAYYDYKNASELEYLIKDLSLTQDKMREAEDAIDYIKQHHISKYVIGHDPVLDHIPERFDGDSVLILDQTYGDASLKYGGIDDDMLPDIEQDILERFKDKKIFLKTHPDVVAGKKKGCFDRLYSHKDVMILPPVSLGLLLAKKPKVVALTSLSGFEAVLYDCNVTLYGLPWYAGYGLTDDRHKGADALHIRRGIKSKNDLFYAAYIKYPIYLDPVTQKPSDFWAALHYLARSARHVRDMSGTLYVFGMSYGSVFHKERGTPWKKRDLYPFLKTEHNKIIYVSDAKDAIKKNILKDHNAKIVVWGYRYGDDIDALLMHKNIPIIRIEDGFVRSYGLGKDFIPPLSLVFDTGNLYYHAKGNNPSDIHTCLAQKSLPYFDKILHDTLTQMRENHITKYNIETQNFVKLQTHKPILCVVGQVPNDASLTYGGLPEGIKNNTDMLAFARQKFPDHYIIFKPHPDIMAGYVQGEDIAQIKNYADRVDMESSLLALIDISDHILVMTSLAGLEAIIRDKKVTALGKPFYSGYGFCEGEAPATMRKQDFIRSVYLDYPLYMHPEKQIYSSCSATINVILQQKKAIINPLRHMHLSHILLKKIYQIKKWILG